MDEEVAAAVSAVSTASSAVATASAAATVLAAATASSAVYQRTFLDGNSISLAQCRRGKCLIMGATYVRQEFFELSCHKLQEMRFMADL